MLDKIQAPVLTLVFLIWSTIVTAQTTPASPSPGASPSGTTGTSPGPAAGDAGMSWIWIALIVVVAAALLYYFLGRGRTGTRP
jgi:hypothetical protein